MLPESKLDQIKPVRTNVNLAAFDEPAARKASFIFKELKKKGKTIDFRDIFAASICIAKKPLPKVFTSI